MKAKLTVGAIAGLLAGTSPAFSIQDVITDFRPGSDGGLQWRVVNDGVMGGLSKGKVALTEAGELVFVGNLSLENNGGFSSIRTNTVSLDFGGSEGLAMRVKGDGRTYQLRLSNSTTYRGREAVFMAEFPTTKGEWTEVKVPFDRFVGTWFGQLIPDARLNPSDVRRLGFLLADKNAGSFALGVDYIRIYGEAPETFPGSPRSADRGPEPDNGASRQALQAIASAISSGVPLFNSGQHAKTAELYEVCLIELARSQVMGRDLTRQLETVVEQGRGISSATERAWYYRHALDASARYLVDAMNWN
jgi:monofunctional biosynthetic peptidoglycan transglycosylase